MPRQAWGRWSAQRHAEPLIPGNDHSGFSSTEKALLHRRESYGQRCIEGKFVDALFTVGTLYDIRSFTGNRQSRSGILLGSSSAVLHKIQPRKYQARNALLSQVPALRWGTQAEMYLDQALRAPNYHFLGGYSVDDCRLINANQHDRQGPLWRRWALPFFPGCLVVANYNLNI